MQVILMENIIKLGKIGDTVEVKNGYGRNYLLKTGKALRASKENIELVNKKKDELNKKNNEIKKKFKEIAATISNKKLNFSKEAKENSELFASIKPKEISTAFSEQLNATVNPSQIDISQEINKLGTYKIKINLHSEVSTDVLIIVKKTDIA